MRNTVLLRAQPGPPHETTRLIIQARYAVQQKKPAKRQGGFRFRSSARLDASQVQDHRANWNLSKQGAKAAAELGSEALDIALDTDSARAVHRVRRLHRRLPEGTAPELGEKLRSI
jgi:hypothetical protein